MKLNFLKVTALVLMLVGTIFLSCDKDDSLIEPQKEVITKTNDNSTPVLMKFNYTYNNIRYNEADWDKKLKTEDKQFYMVGLDEEIYVFDTEAESFSYEKVLETKINANRAIGDECEVAGDVTVKFKINMYNGKNFTKRNFAWFKTHVVTKGTLGLSNNKIQENFPAGATANASSYKVEYVQARGYKGLVGAYPCRDLVMTTKFYIEKKEDLSFTDVLNYDISHSFASEGIKSNSDLSKKKLNPLFSLSQSNSWDNKIKSYYIKFI